MKSKSANNEKEETIVRGLIVQMVKEKKPETVEELVSLVKERSQLSEEKIIHQISRLNDARMISLRPTKSPAESSKDYLRTMDAYWYWFVLATTLGATLAVFLIPESTFPFVYVRYVFGAAFVLWLPGYAFVKALFPGKDLESIERIALSLGLSLAIVPLVGLLLNYSPWGISLVPITLSLCAVTVVFATAAIFRENQKKEP